NTKGAGIHFYWGGWLGNSNAALCARIDDVNAYWCYRGVSVPDAQPFYNSSIGGQFQRCDVGIRVLGSRNLLLNRAYFEFNITAGAQLMRATVLAPQMKTLPGNTPEPEPENDIYCSDVKIMVSDTHGNQ